jgi:hypothetical protein
MRTKEKNETEELFQSNNNQRKKKPGRTVSEQ